MIELPGLVWTVLPSGLKWPFPFIDLRDEVRSHHDLGMIGCAIDPDFAENKWVYFGYVVDPGNPPADDDQFCRVTRYQVSSSNPNVADPSTRQVLGDIYYISIFTNQIRRIRYEDIVSAPDHDVTTSITTQSHPNPFHDATTIDFVLSHPGHASVQVFSAGGQLVRTLASSELASGPHSIEWDGRDDAGIRVNRGVYFYQIQSGGSAQGRKIVLR